MNQESEDLLDKLWRAEQLMIEGKVAEAQPLIQALEEQEDLPPDARLTWQLLKSQQLIIRGELEVSYALLE